MKSFLKNSLLVAWAFVIVRVYLSYMWLSNAENKLVYDFNIGPMLEGQVNSGQLPGFWAGFMKIFVLPFTDIFEALVTVGELCVGIALLAGIFLRFSALMGAIMNFSFLMTFQAGLDLQMMILQVILIVFATQAGRIGLDRYVQPGLRQLFRRQTRKESYA
ncbi:DoxX family protein [Bacillus coahuilensis]|uniref:DoxX family protein n=1 Tax=Bacillus coahuilensis TaxID=408580 RepID=UPI00018512E5|nr:DoxX family protein [Bacillus coahuilensis]